MDIKDVKVGQKVVPHSKTTFGDNWDFADKAKSETRDCCLRFFNENGLLTINAESRSGHFRVSCGCGSGWWLNASDFSPAVIEVGDVVRDGDGTEQVITLIDREGLFAETDKSKGWRTNLSAFDLVRKAKKPAEPEKPWRPKVGDKVVFISEAHQGGIHPKVGTVGTFTYDDGSNNPEFTWPAPLGKHYCTISFLRPATADEIAESEKPADRRPTVGDWVEVVKWGEWHASMGRKPVPIGTVVLVEADDHDHHPFRFHVSGNPVYYAAAEDEVRLTTAPAPQPEADKPREFKVGDRVELVRDNGCHVPAVHIGQKFEISRVKNNGGKLSVWTTSGNVLYESEIKHTSEPATVLRSDAEAAVRRAYITGQAKAAAKIVIDMNPSAETLASFFEADK